MYNVDGTITGVAGLQGLGGELPGHVYYGIPGPQGEPGKDGQDGSPGKDGADGKTPVLGEDYWTPDDRKEIVSDVLSSEELKQMQQDIQKIREDMNYKPIDITGISNNIGTVEKGTDVSEMTVTWSINKDPVSQSLGGEVLDVNVRSKTVSMAGRTSVRLDVTDERGAVDSASTGYNAYNGVYYGILEDGATIDSAAILSLSKKIQSGRGVNFTADCTGGKRIAYAIPASGYGTPVFQDLDIKMPIDMTQVPGTVSFRNSKGYTTDYKVWLSTYVLDRSFSVGVT